MATPKKTLTKTKKKTPSEQYYELQKIMVELMGLKVGSTVEVIREVKENEMGWEGEEIDSKGETYQVEEICPNNSGIYLEDGYWYPIFALKMCANSFILNDDYTAVVLEDGDIEVGCVAISFETLEKIYFYAKEKNDNN